MTPFYPSVVIQDTILPIRYHIGHHFTHPLLYRTSFYPSVIIQDTILPIRYHTGHHFIDPLSYRTPFYPSVFIQDIIFSIYDHTGHRFISSGEVRSKYRLLNWLCVDIRSSATRGMASTVWHVDAARPPRIPSQAVTTRACKVSCGSYFTRDQHRRQTSGTDSVLFF